MISILKMDRILYVIVVTSATYIHFMILPSSPFTLLNPPSLTTHSFIIRLGDIKNIQSALFKLCYILFSQI